MLAVVSSEVNTLVVFSSFSKTSTGINEIGAEYGSLIFIAPELEPAPSEGVYTIFIELKTGFVFTFFLGAFMRRIPIEVLDGARYTEPFG